MFHVVNLPQLQHALVNRSNASRCTPVQAHALKALVGVDSDGRFRTAPSKQYPPRMCALLASASMSFLESVVHHRLDEHPDWEDAATSVYRKFYTPLDPYLEAHAWGKFGADRAKAHSAAHG